MPTRPRTRAPRMADRPLKSPLAVPTGPRSPDSAFGAAVASLSPERLTDRGATRAEFEGYLRTTNNKFGRPHEEATISAYVCPAKALDEWMTAKGIEGDYNAAVAAAGALIAAWRSSPRFRTSGSERSRAPRHTQTAIPFADGWRAC